MSDTALAILARYPELGKGKTRLAQGLGAGLTLDLYRSFLQDLACRFQGWQYDVIWAYTPAEQDFIACVRSLIARPDEPVRIVPQQGPDLGTRLHNVFQETARAGFAYTVLISSDSPQVSRQIIERARRALDDADVVLGPAEDGGYYLIAMREPHDVFSAIPMSTDVVLDMTIDKARQQGLNVQLVDTLFDIDTRSDLQRLADLLRADATLAPATAACLHEIDKRGFLS
ncbi:TIGR04282 family arsenosugar biosynthesis glycosyltransferase [Dictyobacter aurantiacus]|uniref:Glycosyl transferase n=1 Tax=Dictyobacter aurantiacus TaxID=1936993 RepID=A0A401ZFS2_9CHLR|nr:TIGR04282 family arsenosugar biosynthesis glycosyltransferase [Dictyobacter aurantiacus]GCE05686.1 hypothetical protein KDAU_30150 [Dictyobacter aurantiacus]